MPQAVSVTDAEKSVLDSGAQFFEVFPGQADQEESIMDWADFAAMSTQKRLTHEEVFGALRRKLNAE